MYYMLYFKSCRQNSFVVSSLPLLNLWQVLSLHVWVYYRQRFEFQLSLILFLVQACLFKGWCLIKIPCTRFSSVQTDSASYLKVLSYFLYVLYYMKLWFSKYTLHGCNDMCPTWSWLIVYMILLPHLLSLVLLLV